ncbi:Uncharacterized protein involved in ubiquinone biosynthesis [Gloeomargarita lithophora Alchichica-D10]|uniref:Uncharacterized protein involved in ubiquinone biosynthesis n=1 Tax=Gloeomargarita lithophora Alchichica-D10 TaxID=1188229 RepID=A0A1J0ACL2_9CYAN|nr:Coq4 family protein [Gloeomargarita lithophora]APB33657.1 Uncharacterized protein involved in ubiquinone biosynthesis [Gloeomargarita lithophora Alchichica-D10]
MIAETANLAPMMALQPYLALLAGDVELNVVGEMSDALLNTSSFALAVRHLQANDQCAELIAERYMAEDHDIAHLLTYPTDSLGFIYAQSMQAKGFRAEDLYKDVPIYSDASYVEARLSQTHDIWHIVTGFGVSEIEEIGLQAFHLPQFPYPLAVSLLSSSLMSSLLFAPDQLPDLLSAIHTGWVMGKTAKSCFAQKWEERWDKPLAEWRHDLQISPLI